MPAIDIKPWMQELLGQLSHNRQRQLVALQGPMDWCDSQFNALGQLNLPLLVISNRLQGSIADRGPIPFSKADSCLGREAGIVVLDLFTGFNADVLCIAAGLVRASGVLVVLSPAVKDWPLHADRYASWQDQSQSLHPRFAEYFFASLQADDEIGLLLTPESVPTPKPGLPVLLPTVFELGMTSSQADCLRQIEQWIERECRGLVLIRAQRGRGKSSCLGMLVSRLQAEYRILVCADSRATAAALLHWVPQAEFIAPDRLLLENPAADLVVIDEAAMIPLSLLRQIYRLYPRLIMATTSGGYEGTGQGFMLRFVAELEAQKLLQLELEDPVRWCRGDRLELWLDQVLMQSVATEPEVDASIDSSDWQLQVVADPGVLDFQVDLQQVYRLLNAAHYRTRPSDLRMLMENPDLLLIVARFGKQVVGAALLNREGGLDADLCEQIFLGKRRPKGHLLAQMLTAQAGIGHFAEHRGLRILRIAVSAYYRRRGIGTGLLERALEYAAAAELDYLGASFALDAQTTSFWQQTGFSLVHISYAQGKSSGNHSLAILCSLRPAVGADQQQLRRRIERSVPIWMTQFLQDLEAAQVVALLRFASFDASLNDLEQREVEAFAYGNKGFELCFVSLQKFIMQRVAQTSAAVDNLLVEKAIQNRPWERLPRQHRGEGRKQLQNRLRGLVAAML
ncbi:GNAT family N-acetyltransferase [Gammaproteobacteria bacterium]|nr:GNAT family N-acetyltransferase [Gammaproteobacteria bacterium]